MARTKPKRKRQPPRKNRTEVEDQRAEVVTVAWMLCVLATFFAELAGASVRLLTATLDVPPAVRALPNLMLLAALVTGLLSLVLMVFAYRVRRIPPPALVTAFATTVAAVPLIVCIYSTWR